MKLSIIIGVTLSLFGFLFSLISIKLSLKKKLWSDFNKFFWTMTIVKFVLLFLGLMIFIFVLELDKISLILSFMISYLIFSIIEVIYLNKTK